MRYRLWFLVVLLGCSKAEPTKAVPPGTGLPPTTNGGLPPRTLVGSTADPVDASKSGTDPQVPLIVLASDSDFLLQPFAGDYACANLFDHDIPKEFVDNNGRQVTFWGGESKFIDGHNGYDFGLPEGTEVLSAATGVVQVAGQERPFYCPLLNQTVAGNTVQIDSALPDGATYRVVYSHLSEIDVAVGEVIVAGERIGLSGNTGCSTGPHLHFEVRQYAGNQLVVVDPFGWTSTEMDPWPGKGGVPSNALWRGGSAPSIHRDSVLGPSANKGAWVTVATVRWMGVDDAHNPNNEFVELVRDDRYAPTTVSLSTYYLQNAQGETAALPAVVLSANQPSVRVYSGSGTSTSTTVYLGRSTPMWNDMGDCARLVFPNGNSYRNFFQLADCPP